MNQQELSKRWRDNHPNYMKDYCKLWRESHRIEQNEYKRNWRKNNKDYQKEYQKSELNKNGIAKYVIRSKSKRILYIKRKHSKLDNYEIHHCFGYEDPNKFIYVPRDLHLEIHQRLRDLNISADSNHYNAIVDLINSCQQYTYISI